MKREDNIYRSSNPNLELIIIIILQISAGGGEDDPVLVSWISVEVTLGSPRVSLLLLASSTPGTCQSQTEYFLSLSYHLLGIFSQNRYSVFAGLYSVGPEWWRGFDHSRRIWVQSWNFRNWRPAKLCSKQTWPTGGLVSPRLHFDLLLSRSENEHFKWKSKTNFI